MHDRHSSISIRRPIVHTGNHARDVVCQASGTGAIGHRTDVSLRSGSISLRPSPAKRVGVKQVAERVWLVSFMQCDLGYFDDEACQVESAVNPFAAKLSPMSPV